jgi:hypothetical protein
LKNVNIMNKEWDLAPKQASPVKAQSPVKETPKKAATPEASPAKAAPVQEEQ